MLDVIFIASLYVVVFALELVPMIRSSDSKSLRVYLPIYFFALVVSFATALGVELPSPTGLIKNIVSDIFGKTL